MKINNLDCCKPKRRYQTFSGESQNFNKPSSKKILYKHFCEMSKEDIYERSIERASKKAENSGKMRMYKALPLIGAAITGASLALTQPGKTTSKIATGLGFLMFEKGIEDIYKGSSKAYDNADKATKSKMGKESTAKGVLFALTGATMLIGGAVAAAGGKNVLSKFSKSKAGDFVAKEAQQLKNEINTSKIAKKIENKIDPFIKKHSILSYAIPIATATATSCGVGAGQKKLKEGIEKDFTKNVETDYKRSRLSQERSRAKFDKVDAIEI